MENFQFGRTSFQKQGFFDKIKNINFQQLRQLKWKDLTISQKRKIIGGIIVFLLCILLLGLFTQNDEEAYKSNVENFMKYSSNYDVQSTTKTTTSAAHQLIVSQNKKMKETKSKNYKTKIDKIDSKIVSQKGNSIVGTTRVETTEQIGSEQAQNFTHLFIFQGQKIGASWKISNMIEAEAKKVTR